jgi:adenosine kinase
MSSRVLISGSIAFDTIMVFDGRFAEHILPERVHMLNVSFLAPQLRREFGGCAANIAYTLAGLGGHAAILGAVGQDGRAYLERLSTLGIETDAILWCEALYTSQAFITTDLADNQISAFHPGAMMRAHEVAINGPAAWGIIAPNDKAAMLRHAHEFKARGIPWLFDPGQALPQFHGDELAHLIAQADALVVNDYECTLITQHLGGSEAALAQRINTLIVTRGSQGASLYHRGHRDDIAPASITAAVDPTGCGDAFRGALLYGLARGLGWAVSARLGNILGALKIEHAGPQNHVIQHPDIIRRYTETYGQMPW